MLNDMPSDTLNDTLNGMPSDTLNGMRRGKRSYPKRNLCLLTPGLNDRSRPGLPSHTYKGQY